MYLLKDISETFSTTFSLSSSEEKFEEAVFCMCAFQFAMPGDDTFQVLLSKIDVQDKCEISMTLGESTTLTFQSSTTKGSDFLKELATKQEYYTQGDKIELRLSISKKKKDSCINIYCIKAFSAFLEELTIEEILINFSTALAGDSYLLFNCFDIAYSFNSKSFYFHTLQDKTLLTNAHEGFNRDEVIDKVSTNCSFTISQPIKLLPEDFFIIQKDNFNPVIYKTFNRALSALVITSIFDITILKGNQLFYKLNGYKSINGNVQIIDPLKSYKNYYEIYHWVYAGGNLTDKIGLARNIISLHFEKRDSLELDTNVYVSLVSSHKVYEKQNIKQYIELRNKISDQIYSFNEKANKIIEGFASGFQKSAIAFVSLFSTIVITKVLTTKSFTNIFTFDATIISLLFLSGSLIYFFVSLWEVNAQLDRFKNSYLNMKKRNEDLLTVEDIDRILSKDTEHLADLKFIKDKRTNYSVLWISFLILFLTATLLLHWEYTKVNRGENSLFKSQIIPEAKNGKSNDTLSKKPRTDSLPVKVLTDSAHSRKQAKHQ